VGLAGAGAVLAGVSAYEAVQATRQYDDAAAMKDPAGTGVVPPYTVDQYNALVSAAGHDRAVAIGTGVGAGVALATSAVLGWMSWRQSGEIGPFRF
jgi:hypothetical protein